MATSPPNTTQHFTPRPKKWVETPDHDWNDWQWQLKHRISDLETILQILQLTPEEKAGLNSDHRFRVDITPYFMSLIDADNPNCPIRRQVIPLGRELLAFEGMEVDSLEEDQHSPVPGLVHRYPDRVLMLVTTHCASYCRYCTRSRMVGDPKASVNKQGIDLQIEYLQNTPQVRDVLISGGDPLTLSTTFLNYVLSRLRAVPHIEIIRIGSRVPIFLPQRITDELCNMLRRYHPLWLNVHINHPKEITPEASNALAKLVDAGIPLGNQSVLLAGINDSLAIQKELVHTLVINRIRPYYLYQCDLVKGSGHFRTPIAKGIEIMEGLRGHTSGYAVPTYVVDAPGGGGKIPIAPQYLLSQGVHQVALRNYEGYITVYQEPENYFSFNQEAPLPETTGVSSLLSGHQKHIKPENFDQAHDRKMNIKDKTVTSG
ncbi:lysine 2,3-aminomutase [Adonisia turfae]|uniref:L-lysine 2,3-aminomutase n=1 Tax=Adonisia turfae CCMR0081 TaxID=2292702 RepID=A0A6M0RTL9_9CYAN|nr:lysine 2,3-aminomutase [Adonisia turfae]NEZ59113.1 lysine 2,3-aminomutase [Adonisia turfae CCMR0081]